MCLNCILDGATLVPEIRKPFDVLAEGLISEAKRIGEGPLLVSAITLKYVDGGPRGDASGGDSEGRDCHQDDHVLEGEAAWSCV